MHMSFPLCALLALACVTAGQSAETLRFPVTSPLSLWQQAYGEKPSSRVYLYHDPEASFLQGIHFLVRSQYQFSAVSANQGTYPGSHGSTSEWRRFTLGGGVEFFKNFHFVNIWNIGGLDSMGYEKNGIWQDHGQTHGSVSEIYLEYVKKGNPSIRIGKQFPHFMAENRHIGADLNAPELPALEAQLATGSVYAIKISEDSPDKIFGWGAAVWSNTDKSSRSTWGTWQSVGTLANISSRVNDTLMKKGRISLDWTWSSQDMDRMAALKSRDNFTGSRAQNTLSLYYVGSEGPADLVLEALWAHKPAAYRQGNETMRPSQAFGIMVMPMYMLSERWQILARGQWSKGNDAIKLNPRYESLSPTNGLYVDEYRAVGVGVNFFVYPGIHNRLKIMAFVEYVNTDKRHGTGGFTGWNFTAGIYTNF